MRRRCIPVYYLQPVALPTPLQIFNHLLLLLMAAMVAAVPAGAEPLVVYAAGDIADCRDRPPAATDAARTAKLIPPAATVLIPGDTAYPFATAATLRSCFEPTWGANRATTIAVPGNHDYVDGRSDDYRAYFGVVSQENYYTRRLGDWLVIGLDSQLIGAALEREYQWLDATLSENADVRCTLALWHMPAFSSGLEHGPTVKMQRFWALLEGRGVEFVLNGHEHFYEAFDPLDAAGVPAADGMREFVVGTGGARLYPIWSPVHVSRIRLARHGVLKVSLDAGAYSWQFIDTSGRVRDRGEANCRP
jgi:acid phosphatase type 7